MKTLAMQLLTKVDGYKTLIGAAALALVALVALLSGNLAAAGELAGLAMATVGLGHKADKILDRLKSSKPPAPLTALEEVQRSEPFPLEPQPGVKPFTIAISLALAFWCVGGAVQARQAAPPGVKNGSISAEIGKIPEFRETGNSCCAGCSCGCQGGKPCRCAAPAGPYAHLPAVDACQRNAELAEAWAAAVLSEARQLGYYSDREAGPAWWEGRSEIWIGGGQHATALRAEHDHALRLARAWRLMMELRDGKKAGETEAELRRLIGDRAFVTGEIPSVPP